MAALETEAVAQQKRGAKPGKCEVGSICFERAVHVPLAIEVRNGLINFFRGFGEIPD